MCLSPLEYKGSRCKYQATKQAVARRRRRVHEYLLEHPEIVAQYESSSALATFIAFLTYCCAFKQTSTLGFEMKSYDYGVTVREFQDKLALFAMYARSCGFLSMGVYTTTQHYIQLGEYPQFDGSRMVFDLPPANEILKHLGVATEQRHRR